jgi:hypothetical protein
MAQVQHDRDKKCQLSSRDAGGLKKIICNFDHLSKTPSDWYRKCYQSM